MPHVGEGDLRLIDQGEIDNWTTGRLQVFFEGSWSQVCATGFDAPDANVSCRQLGFGAGAVMPHALSTEDLDEFRRTNIYPEVAITGVSCAGTEERLIDCSVDDGPRASDNFDSGNMFGRACLNSVGEGLVIACVTSLLQGPAAGTFPPLWIPSLLLAALLLLLCRHVSFVHVQSAHKSDRALAMYAAFMHNMNSLDHGCMMQRCRCPFL